MKISKRILSGILSAVMLTSALTAAPVTAFAATASADEAVGAATSGTTGGCKWSYNTSTKALTISGKGKMADYDSQYDVPWNDYVHTATSLTINSGVTYVGQRCFVGYKFTSVSIADTVTEIGEDAFWSCSDVTKLILSSKLKKIGDSAFSNLAVTSLTLPGTLTYLGDSAFSYCKKLKSVTIPDGCTVALNGTFQGCTAMETVSIGKSVSAVDERAFAYCPVTEYKVSASNTVVTSGAGHLYNKDKTVLLFYKNGMTNTKATLSDNILEIGDYCFAGNKTITTYDLPAKLTRIGTFAFESSKATTISFPNTVTHVGNNSFYNTPWLNKQANGVVYAGKVAYQYKGTVPQTLSLKSDTVAIADEAFKESANLVTITFPQTLTHIGDAAFLRCSKLKTATLPKKLVAIGATAFSGCSSLTSVVMPDTVTSIGEHCYYECSSLKTLTLSKNLTEIPRWCFGGCSKLTSVNISVKVKKIGWYAFAGCTGIPSFTIPNAKTEFELWALGNGMFGGKNGNPRVVRGFRGSTAQTIAEGSNFEFKPIISDLKGDADLNEVVDIRDATQIQRFLAGTQQLTTQAMINADTNGDGRVNIRDVTEIQRYVAGLISSFK